MSVRSRQVPLERFQDTIAEARDKLVVLYFYTKWSLECSQLSDLLPDLMEREDPAWTMTFKIDLEEAPDLILKYKVTSVPTLVILLNGEAVDRVEGMNVEELLSKLRALKDHVEMPPLVAREDQIAESHQ